MAFSESVNAVITSRSNARVKQLRAAFAGQSRLSEGLVAIEGDNLLNEAIRSGISFDTIFISERRELPSNLPRGVQVLRLANDVLASAVETQSPQGIAALFTPRVHKLESVVTKDALIVVAANLQDPGNLGTLIRSAEAFGATGVLTTPGTVSPWNQKALRASAGSVFRTPVVAATLEDLVSLKSHGIQIAAAVAEDAYKVIPAHKANFAQPTAILIGNEGSGLADELLQLADIFVTIPCPGRVESLNAAVAGSLLFYEAAQQRASKAKV